MLLISNSDLKALTIELTLTVTQMVNNWKEMNELTVAVTQKIGMN